MPRSIILGNGSLLATFDDRLQMRDCYFPFVGMEDHTGYGDAHYLGVFVEGKGFAWTADPSWDVKPRYMEGTLVGQSIMTNAKLGLSITVEDAVHPVRSVLVRHLRARSTDGESKRVRFFFNHDFHIYGDKQKDTAFYEPYTNTVIHYRQSRYFLIGADTSDPLVCSDRSHISSYQSILHSKEFVKSCGISSYSIGKSEYHGLEGTWRDAEDGELAMTTIDQGSVDSTVGIHCTVSPDKETDVWLWVCFGRTLDEVIDLHQLTLQETPAEFLRNAETYWRSWIGKQPNDLGSLAPEIADLFHRSLQIVRLHIDSNGGIVAAADSDIMAFNKDTYTYVWPRDGAFVSMALDRAGYSEATHRFFEFCARVQTADGYLLHKYNPDGSYGSSWHPWFRDGEAQLPIQEDETALILVALWHHFQSGMDFEFCEQMYQRFLKGACRFLMEYREESSHLPLPSYDPWEEHRGVFTYTTACTVAGLSAAADLCRALGHYTHEKRYRDASEEMKEALLTHLYDESKGRFLKMIRRKDGETIERDSTIDASLAMVWKLGVLPADDPRILSTMTQIGDVLSVETGTGGIARYQNDLYHSVTPPTPEIPGNPWIITTLWTAQWLIATAKHPEDLEPARDVLTWVTQHASPTGMLPEQLNPLTGEHLSVAPLTWSHATFVETVLLFAEKERKLTRF